MASTSSETWAQMFKDADKDKSGSIDAKEMKELLRNGNSNITDSQIQDVFVFFEGPNGDKKITYDEFSNGMKKIEEFVVFMTEEFKKADKDGSGHLDVKELREMLNKSSQKFTDADVEQIFKDADTSGDGKMSLNEFVARFS